MDTKTALYISYAAIALSLSALAFSVLASTIGLKLHEGPTRVLQVLSVIWPLGFYAAALYRKKIAKDAEQ
jgi:hypothetical protein